MCFVVSSCRTSSVVSNRLVLGRKPKADPKQLLNIFGKFPIIITEFSSHFGLVQPSQV